MIKKNNKIMYWLRSLLMLIEPRCILMYRRKKLFDEFYRMSKTEQEQILKRVDYYCSLPNNISLPETAPKLGNHKFFTKSKLTRHSVYFFDSYEYTRYFPDSLHWQIEEGDVNIEMTSPTFTKTRPIIKRGVNDKNLVFSNNVIINMDKIRHFLFINDPLTWEEKHGKVLFRGVIYNKENRRRFVEMYGDNSLCDLKDVDRHSKLPERFKTHKLMTLREHLEYRYIMSLEGNDVASNLKWVMSSNSIAVMPQPTCESWYMEGSLIPNVHYIEIAPDFHNLIERIEYYENNPEEAKAIVKNAHEWVKQFQKKKRENIISLMVLEKYFHSTGQTTSK